MCKKSPKPHNANDETHCSKMASPFLYDFQNTWDIAES